MKYSISVLKKYSAWFVACLFINILSALLIWIADINAFKSLMYIMVLSSAIIFGALFFKVRKNEMEKEQAFISFIQDPNVSSEQALLKLVGCENKEIISLIAEALKQRETDYAKAQTNLADYQEYVEAWTHETKIPIALLTLILDSRKDELPENIFIKLDHIRNKMKEAVEKMLFYSKVKGEQKDYLFEHIEIKPFIDEVLEDYNIILNEKGFKTMLKNIDGQVFTDKRGFRFILNQIISNSVKYSSKAPVIEIEFLKNEKNSILCVRDNGIGVKKCDMPYIFQKGFTGDTGENRATATGMGLYLAYEMSKEMKITLEAGSELGKWFEMKIIFPNL